MTDECGWQRWTSQVGDSVGLVRDLWPSFQSRIGPEAVLGCMENASPRPTGSTDSRWCITWRTRWAPAARCAFRQFLMCLQADWRPTVGRFMSTGGSVLVEVVGELPAEEGGDGRPAAIARVEGAPLLEVLSPCDAVTSEHPAAPNALPDGAASCGARRPFGVTMCRSAPALRRSCS
jgi:hypothetical protein